ncbi:lipocalin family protein [Psychroserpens sp. BH13MA-6]
MKKIVFLLLCILAFNCNASKDYNLITGTWHCGTWIVESSGKDLCNDEVMFKFNSDRTYKSQIGYIAEQGTFEILNDQLICYPRDKMEIGVQINKLTNDTLEFTMSRSGRKEIMTLLKQ